MTCFLYSARVRRYAIRLSPAQGVVGRVGFDIDCPWQHTFHPLVQLKLLSYGQLSRSASTLVPATHHFISVCISLWTLNLWLISASAASRQQWAELSAAIRSPKVDAAGCRYATHKSLTPSSSLRILFLHASDFHHYTCPPQEICLIFLVMPPDF